MRRLLYIFPKAFPWDIRVEKICKALASSGFEIIILCRWKGEEKEIEVFEGFKIIRVGYNNSTYKSIPVQYNYYWRKKIREIINAYHPEIILSREIILSYDAGILAREYKIPIIMDMAENYPAAMRDWKGYKDNLLLNFTVNVAKIPDKLEKKSVPLMNGIITVCEEQCQRLNRFYHYSYDNMEVVHNTPELGWFHGVKCGSDKPPRVFGHHGYLSGDKRVDILVKGFILSAAHNKDIHLILAGDGECFDEIKQIVDKSDYRDRIHLLGNYQFSDLKKIISKIDVGVIPYQISDFNNYTIHNKVFDYFAAGKAVIVTPNQPLIRIISETNAGIILKEYTSESMSEAIDNVINHDISEYERNSLSAARNKYNWEVDSKTLISFVSNYMKGD